MRRLLIALVLGACAACGLRLSGLGVDGAADASLPRDGGADAPAPMCPGIAGGWSAVVVETATGACPDGYGPQHEKVSGAQAGANACACSCSIVAQPSCDNGILTVAYGTGGGTPVCNSMGSPLMVDGSACTPLPGPASVAPAVALGPLAPGGGACVGTTVSDTTSIVKTTVSYCDVSTGAAAAVCGGSAPAGTSACIVADGDVPCPAGTPFSNRTVVADDETLFCSSCTNCVMATSCEGASLKLFADTACADLVVDVMADGGCHPTGVTGNAVVNGFEYSASVDAGCAASGAAATFQAVNPHTLCCR